MSWSISTTSATHVSANELGLLTYVAVVFDLVTCLRQLLEQNAYLFEKIIRPILLRIWSSIVRRETGSSSNLRIDQATPQFLCLVRILVYLWLELVLYSVDLWVSYVLLDLSYLCWPFNDL